MLIYRRTSLFESTAQTLVNTVNCVGVMGKGVAHAFKVREPAMFEAYKRICDRKLLSPGKLWLWRGDENWVLNFPTKIHWRNPSKLEWIEQGLIKFADNYAKQGITQISFPQLGCGNGNLDWDDVRPLMETHLSKLSIPVYIHDFTVDVGLPEHLEPVATALKNDTADGNSFDGFMALIGRAVEVSDGRLSTLGSDNPFALEVGDDQELSIDINSTRCVFEADYLRGVWLELQNGLVTRREAGRSDVSGAEPLLSLLSVLPNLRPVQIQRVGTEAPEYAVERRPELRGAMSTGLFKQDHHQNEFAWH